MMLHLEGKKYLYNYLSREIKIQLRSVQLSVHTIFLIILSCYIAMPFNLFISMSVGLPCTQHPLG